MRSKNESLLEWCYFIRRGRVDPQVILSCRGSHSAELPTFASPRSPGRPPRSPLPQDAASFLLRTTKQHSPPPPPPTASTDSTRSRKQGMNAFSLASLQVCDFSPRGCVKLKLAAGGGEPQKTKFAQLLRNPFSVLCSANLCWEVKIELAARRRDSRNLSTEH